MTDYKESRWSDSEFSERYASGADDIILERRRLIDILVSFYGHFFGDRDSCRVLDLGCGDGTLTHELIRLYPNVSATLVDGSPDMLKRAENALHGKRVEFIQASFQELLAGKFDLPKYDFVFSSLAIHHLSTLEKADLFGLIKDGLKEGGRLLTIDVVLPPSEALEGWYLDTWREWVDSRDGEDGREIISRYKGNPDNRPDTLDSQLDSLRALGYKDVDCYYKYGIFAIFGGANQP